MQGDCALHRETEITSSLLRSPTACEKPCCPELKRILEKNGITDCMFAFIGGGKMADCLVDGFFSAGLIHKDSVAISVKSEKSKLSWQQRGYENVFTSNVELLSRFGKGIVFLAVHPDVWRAIITELPKDAFVEAKLIISVMAGVSMKELQSDLSPYNSGIVRLMPNTPVVCGAGTFLLCAEKNIGTKVEVAKYLTVKVGAYKEIDEDRFNVATTLANCSTAFIYTIIDAMADGGVLNGMNRTEAIELIARGVYGAAKMVLVTGVHPGMLKDNVTTPSGATIVGIRALERAGVRRAFIDAVCECTERLNEM
uniref:pyrroline-5-carboxylate reductase n=1 Tax=Syphacia muris TaxID=451379 RepID=A0A0N5AJM3_9BILA